MRSRALLPFALFAIAARAEIPGTEPTLIAPSPGEAAAAVGAPISRDARIADVRARLVDLEDQIAELKSAARSRSRAYHALSQGRTEASFIWQPTEAHDPARRRLALKMASLDLKQIVKRIEHLESKREELAFEKEWLALEVDKSALEPSVSATAKKNAPAGPPLKRVTALGFVCQTLPVEALDGETAQVVQNFGQARDPESGITWQSSGWWVQRLKADVRACGAGKVAFSGKIPGRGSVVLVDHGQGIITLYANLSDGELPTRGTKVEAGTVLGQLRDKFYFEIRRDGLAIDPKSVFAAERLARFSGH